MWQWGRFYKQLNEVPPKERPSENVIENDTALDQWYESYVRRLGLRSGSAGSREDRYSFAIPEAPNAPV